MTCEFVVVCDVQVRAVRDLCVLCVGRLSREVRGVRARNA